MKNSSPKTKEGDDRQLIEDINQLNRIALGEGAAACQVCGSSFYEGDAVTVYVFRSAGEVIFQVGFVVCGDGQHKPPKEYTLGVRELLVEGRVGWCSDAATQSSWPVLLAPEVVAVSEVSTKAVREISSGDSESVNVAVSSDDAEEQRSSVKVSVGEAHRRAARSDDEAGRRLNWGGKR